MIINKKNKKIIEKTIKECAHGCNVVNITKFGKPTKKQNIDYRISVLKEIPRLKKNQKIFDIGTSWGGYLFPIAEINKDAEIYGLEPKGSPMYLKEFFKEKIKKYNIKLCKQDLTKDKLPFRDNFFDVILFSEVIEHIHPSKLDFVLNEIRRILKKEGVLIITTPNLLSIVHRIRFLLGYDFGWDISPTPKYAGTYHHIKEYSLKELLTIFKNKNFKTIKAKFLNIGYGIFFLDIINNFLGLFFKNFRNNIVIVFKKQ